jgi:hypothetical protein
MTMVPYEVQTSVAVEEFFESEGFDRNADIIPSAVAVPEDPGANWLSESAKLLDEAELNPETDAELINSLFSR